MINNVNFIFMYFEHIQNFTQEKMLTFKHLIRTKLYSSIIYKKLICINIGLKFKFFLLSGEGGITYINTYQNI